MLNREQSITLSANNPLGDKYNKRVILILADVDIISNSEVTASEDLFWNYLVNMHVMG